MTNNSGVDEVEEYPSSVQLSRAAAETLGMVSRSEINLQLTHARDGNDRGVFVPFMEWHMVLDSQLDNVPDAARDFYLKITLDNLAFLIEDMTSEVAENTEALQKMAAGSEERIAPPLDAAISWLQRASENALRAAETLKAIHDARDEAS
ncbi:hypothetical protein [Allosediminivita pacifica]|uniref:Uncharacterized protein n=1 Tax=Allosediminivita pacifica TaxID=1267769 RepID=A0A2T5ZVU2_9RHOB|nr:hypothetical protein [Allosediminivita pacifica]PTX35683.1 hypothetical protein C8N44_1682 [Allosediminivita pacifica]GGB31152.1 hypothetical protein GCM10011324_45760 [Allosediminivita pacifica]